ncbi:MAG: hypothetical protein COV67_12645 [Nitrospinae bacterium CG11_big_fil_rev_8_21_14_0_20_56_8]|nr:MAG: hypothetical protein COV67_12645 [Nitrospinae bacterium CG11_big_fil_rev_8_21_14_0_20_56_8]
MRETGPDKIDPKTVPTIEPGKKQLTNRNYLIECGESPKLPNKSLSPFPITDQLALYALWQDFI